MSFTLNNNCPQRIVKQLERLSKNLPLKQVDNIMASLNSAIQYQLYFYLQLYSNIIDWRIDTFYWQKQIPIQTITNNHSESKQSSQHTENLSNSNPLKSIPFTYYRLPSIFNYISHIHFTTMNAIILTETNLSSLEPLSHLNTPNLKSISLSYNHITNLKPFAKSSFPQVHFINLIDNHWSAHELSSLTRSKLPQNNSKMMMGLFSSQVKRNPLKDMNYSIVYLSALMKGEPCKVNFIISIENYRICQKKMKAAFKQRFDNKTLFY